jgi:endonuclease/exonuclease/phosphatase family metal-dependent hydrolase
MPELTIVSFNAHAGLRARRGGVCAPYDLTTVIRDFDADVIVLQESWAPDAGIAVARTLAGEMGAHLFELPFGRGLLHPWPHVPRNRDGLGSIGLAVISKIPAIWCGEIALGRIPGDPAPARGGLHVQLQAGTTPVDLVGIHLTSRLPHGPPIQLQRLRRQLPTTDHPMVIAGDCNFWGPGVQTFLPGWRRTVRGRTWPADRPHSQIDHILIRDGIELVSAEVLPAVGSDHRPVRATLRVQ